MQIGRTAFPGKPNAWNRPIVLIVESPAAWTKRVSTVYNVGAFAVGTVG